MRGNEQCSAAPPLLSFGAWLAAITDRLKAAPSFGSGAEKPFDSARSPESLRRGPSEPQTHSQEPLPNEACFRLGVLSKGVPRNSKVSFPRVVDAREFVAQLKARQHFPPSFGSPLIAA